MSTSAEEIYTQVIRNLLPTERLRLANLILNDLVQQNVSVLDQSDTWTEQDLVDITNFTLQYANILFSESEETS
ncbi:hypothetical protein JYQ62_28195 [Nostoc sp. UHCC 0702]|nr:hypothetical protein JYQ62_28195 [Nostoc sp. UHCC 0702]